jgi:wobble nucleotide-excising tRNase
MRQAIENISLRGKRVSIEILFLFFVWNTKFSVQEYGSYNDTEIRKEEKEQRRQERDA